jgi:ribosomal protein S18 acetylase RimI-like enzyme
MTEHDPQVRPARADDRETIATFQEAMALATEGKRLDPDVVRRGVGRALADPDRGFYLCATIDGRVVGSLLVTREWSDWRDGWFWWIQSVYVDESVRRRGIYRALHRAVWRLAEQTGDVIGIRLYVEDENTGAQATYRALGMQETSYRLFEQTL